MIDYERLWLHVVGQRHKADPFTVHGPDHWRRVERNALILSTKTGAEVDVIRLFALFHDARRINDGWDLGHGERGAEYARTLRGTWFDLPDESYEKFHFACSWHTDGGRHDDPTIGTCWDADRLDLGRVGMIPDPSFMSTRFGAEIAQHGSIEPWHQLLPNAFASQSR